MSAPARVGRGVTATALAMLAAAPHAAAQHGGRVRVAEVVEIDDVPSWFPVGFCLLTRGTRQYVAYYDRAHDLVVAARDLGEPEFHRVKLPTRIGWDSHNSVTMAVDDRGHLHVAGNMHGVPLIYFRTAVAGDVDTLRRRAMTGEDEQRCTYPHFLQDGDGRLVFHYRSGSSGDGRRIFNRYDPETASWSRLLPTPLFDGEGERNAYPQGPTRGPDGRFHVVWVWRDTPDCATNHHLCYARSADLQRWETAAGEPVELPMTLGQQALWVDPVPSGGGILNGCERLAFDGSGRPVVSYHKADADGHMQVYVARFEAGRWVVRAVTEWARPVPFSGYGAMGFIGIRISGLRRGGPDTWYLTFRHRDYGAGRIVLDEQTLEVVDRPVTTGPKLPREVTRRELDFPGIAVRTASDLGHADAPDVRYLLKWETLPPNHDRPREGALPEPSRLKLFRLVAE